MLGVGPPWRMLISAYDSISNECKQVVTELNDTIDPVQ